MLCERCNNNEAKIHLIKIVNGKKTDIKLCENCMREITDVPLDESTDGNKEVQFQNILGGFFEAIYKNKGQKIDIICKNCGLTYSQFKSSGILGCPKCYDNFSESLKPMIKRFQGDIEHVGKLPKRIGDEFIEKKKINRLKEELQKAIIEEEYENAANLRDKIKELQNHKNEGENHDKLDK